ncbi:MAG TPA: HNH endonuclease [Ignavibacteria bacterium]|nr:HNH endonuclease [Ignavibacteria bacterium]
MSISQSIKSDLYKRAGGRCECTMSVCGDHNGRRCSRGLSAGYWDAHHKTSVAAGGLDVLSNLTAMCATCHKNTRTYGQ